MTHPPSTRAPLWPILAAAGVALAIGALAGAQVSNAARAKPAAGLEAAVIAPGHPLFAVLEARASAALVKLSATDVVRPVLTFKDAQGRVCRTFEVAARSAMAIGVACRGAQAWRLELLLPAADRPSDGEPYVEATGYDTTAMDAVMARLGAGAPLSASEEQAALETR